MNLFPIIDAHSHLWLRQDTLWDGKTIRTLRNGRSIFLDEEVQMLPPFMIDGRNTAEVFLSNMKGGSICTSSSRKMERPFLRVRMVFPSHEVSCRSHR